MYVLRTSVSCFIFYWYLADSVDITEHKLNLILDLVWILILRYQLGIVQGASQADDVPKEDKGEKKEKNDAEGGVKKTLLAWVQANLPNTGVTNFHSDWNDGRKISALVDRMKPGLIPDHEHLNPENALDNIRKAMDMAEEHFGIPKVRERERERRERETGKGKTMESTCGVLTEFVKSLAIWSDSNLDLHVQCMALEHI